MAAGESSIKILTQLFSAKTSLSDTLSEIRQNNRVGAQTQAQDAQTVSQIGAEEREEAQISNNIQNGESTLDDYYNTLNDIVENQNPLDKLYGNIGEFVQDNSGMCGMGMGMGHMEIKPCLQLTGAELVALSTALNENVNPEGTLEEQANSIADRVNNALKELGISENESKVTASGGSIVLERTNPDGTKTQIEFKDANGDGNLNGCDYDFSNALKEFNKDLTQWNKDIQKYEGLIQDTQEYLDDQNERHDEVLGVLDNLNKVHLNQQNLIAHVNEQIAIDEQQAAYLQEKMESLGLEYQALVLEETSSADSTQETPETNETPEGVNSNSDLANAITDNNSRVTNHSAELLTIDVVKDSSGSEIYKFGKNYYEKDGTIITDEDRVKDIGA